MLRIVFLLIGSLFVSFAKAGEPFTVFEGNEALAPKQPQACMSRSGTVHLVFGVGNEVYYSKLSSDRGAKPKSVFTIPNMSLGMRRGPRVACSGSTLVITAIGGPEGKGRDGDILSYRSIDDGATWSGPTRVNDVEGAAREGLHAMTVAEDGTLWCVWLDLRQRGTELFVSKSIDQGGTWSENRVAYRSPSGSVCECCHPSILADADSVHILFRNSLKGDRDMYMVSSNDRGATFGRAERLGVSSWQLNQCPMDGGMLAVDERGEVSTVWRRNQNVFMAGRQAVSESMVGGGEQPWISGGTGGFFTVWTSKREGDLMLLKPGAASSQKLDDSSSFPVVVSDAKAKAGAYVLWEKRRSEGYAIVGQRIE